MHPPHRRFIHTATCETWKFSCFDEPYPWSKTYFNFSYLVWAHGYGPLNGYYTTRPPIFTSTTFVYVLLVLLPFLLVCAFCANKMSVRSDSEDVRMDEYDFSHRGSHRASRSKSRPMARWIQGEQRKRNCLNFCNFCRLYFCLIKLIMVLYLIVSFQLNKNLEN